MKLDIRKYRSRDAFDNASYSLGLSVIVVLGGSMSAQLIDRKCLSNIQGKDRLRDSAIGPE